MNKYYNPAQEGIDALREENKMSKYTPGPWKLEYVVPFIGPAMGGRPAHMAVKGPNGEYICSPGGAGKEITADARLIVAAPDMLAALRGLVAELDSVNNPAPGLIHARLAIAKAQAE